MRTYRDPASKCLTGIVISSSVGMNETCRSHRSRRIQAFQSSGEGMRRIQIIVRRPDRCTKLAREPGSHLRSLGHLFLVRFSRSLQFYFLVLHRFRNKIWDAWYLRIERHYDELTQSSLRIQTNSKITCVVVFPSTSALRCICVIV